MSNETTKEQLSVVEALLKDALEELGDVDTSDDIQEEVLAAIHWGIQDAVDALGELISRGGEYQ
jgi:hypothetical protein